MQLLIFFTLELFETGTCVNINLSTLRQFTIIAVENIEYRDIDNHILHISEE